MSQTLLDALTAISGKSNVLFEGDLSAWEQDWRKRSRGKALAVVRPAHTLEVSAIVKACVAAGVSIVAQGGNTGLVDGSTPDNSGQRCHWKRSGSAHTLLHRSGISRRA